MSFLATVVLPLCVIGINHALFETDKQATLISRRTTKIGDEEYWRAQFQSGTNFRALVNLALGMSCIIMYAIFLTAPFLLVTAVTFFAHTLFYLYLVWQVNELYILQIVKTPRENIIHRDD
jgi:hypothetical protein